MTLVHCSPVVMDGTRSTRIGSHERVVFLHVPKTAGSSVHMALSRLFPPDAICPERLSEIGLLPSAVLAQYRLFSAHATIADFADVPRPARFVTFLRDPIERALSLYDYWRSYTVAAIERHNLYEPRLARALSPEEFFAPYNNWRTHASAAYTDMVLGYPADREGHTLQSDPGPRARAAIRQLERFDFVGIVEAMQPSLDRLMDILEMPRLNGADRVNVTAENAIHNPDLFEAIEPVEIEEALLAKIIRQNASDQIIYDHFAARLLSGEVPSRVLTLLSHEGSVKRRAIAGEMACRSQPGYLLFGPYTRLRPGRYRAIFSVDSTAIHDQALIDVDAVHRHGTRLLSARSAGLAELRGGRVSLDFDLDTAATDLELRVFDRVGGTPCAVEVLLEPVGRSTNRHL